VSPHAHASVGTLSAAAYAGIFVFGIVMALLGAVMPALSAAMAFALGDIGTLFLVMNGAMLVASLVVGPVMDRFGTKGPLVLGASLVAAALLLIVRASQWSDLLPAVAGLGFGGGALNASTNTLVADLHEEPRRKASALNLLGVFFGFGALVLPFSIGALLARAGLGGVLLCAAGICAATGLAAAAVRFPPAKQSHQSSVPGVSGLWRHPLVLTLACLLFFQSGNEFVLSGYVATFLTRELRMSIVDASYLLAGYWSAIMASRLFLSKALLILNAQQIVLGGAIASALGAAIVAVATTPLVAAIGIVVTGMALAGIFPTVLGVAGAAFQRQSGAVFGILFSAALTGGMTMPWIAGHLAESSGLRVVFYLTAANFFAVAILDTLARRWRSS
jgi:fucose permease